jgi:hypothetical protein
MELLLVLVLDMIQILPPLGKYKYDTWRILSVKCYIDNSMRLRSCIQNINIGFKTLLNKVPNMTTIEARRSDYYNLLLRCPR